MLLGIIFLNTELNKLPFLHDEMTFMHCSLHESCPLAIKGNDHLILWVVVCVCVCVWGVLLCSWVFFLQAPWSDFLNIYFTWRCSGFFICIKTKRKHVSYKKHGWRSEDGTPG